MRIIHTYFINLYVNNYKNILYVLCIYTYTHTRIMHMLNLHVLIL